MTDTTSSGLVDEAQAFAQQQTTTQHTITTQTINHDTNPTTIENNTLIPTNIDNDDNIDDEQMLKIDVKQAGKDAQEAVDEAKRKEEKLKMLKQRATAALEA